MQTKFIIPRLTEADSQEIFIYLREHNYGVSRMRHFGNWALLVSHDDTQFITVLMLKYDGVASFKQQP